MSKCNLCKVLYESEVKQDKWRENIDE